MISSIMHHASKLHNSNSDTSLWVRYVITIWLNSLGTVQKVNSSMAFEKMCMGLE